MFLIFFIKNKDLSFILGDIQIIFFMRFIFCRERLPWIKLEQFDGGNLNIYS